MKDSGLVFDTRRHAIHDGPGIRVSIFMKGCPLSCLWCHNPEGISFEPEIILRPERCIDCGACRATGYAVDVCPSGAKELAGRPLHVKDVLALAEAESPYFDASGGGVTFTGGEPLSQPGFVLSALEELSRRGFHTVVDTSGYAETATLLSIAKYTNLFLYDIKHMDDALHLKFTGVSHKIIHANIKALADNGADVIVSVPLVPGYNVGDANLTATAVFISGLKPAGRSFPYPVRILPFHNSASAKYQRMGREYACASLAVPDIAQIEHAAAIFIAYGIDTSIGGLS